MQCETFNVFTSIYDTFYQSVFLGYQPSLWLIDVDNIFTQSTMQKYLYFKIQMHDFSYHLVQLAIWIQGSAAKQNQQQLFCMIPLEATQTCLTIPKFIKSFYLSCHEIITIRCPSSPDCVRINIISSAENEVQQIT